MDTPRDTAALREQLRQERLALALARARAERALLEGVAPFGGGGLVWPSWTGVPGDVQDEQGRWWRPLTGRPADRLDGRERPLYDTEQDLDQSRALARQLAARNPLAQGALSSLTNYAIKKGFQYEAAPEDGLEADQGVVDLASQVQRVVDEFCALNSWAQRERSAFRRSRRDGEVFVRLFAQPDGSTLARFVEPEQVRQPLGSPQHWSFGIETDPADIETVLAYAVTYEADRPDDWECVPAEEIAHLRLNVDESSKRGVSDFFSTYDAFEGALKLLRNMRETGAVQAAIAWIEQFDTGVPSVVAANVAARRDLNRPDTEHPVTGRATNYQRYEPGSIPKVGKGRTYIPGPLAANTNQHIAIVQASLRAVGVRWNMPEYLISGDASNANYASTLVAGSPFVNAVECEQDVYSLFFLRCLWTAVRNACAAGRVTYQGRRISGEECQRLVDIHATPPLVAVADPARDSQVDLADIQAGVMSRQERRRRRGLDSEQMRRELAEEPVAPPAPPAPAPGLPGFPEGRLRESVQGAAQEHGSDLARSALLAAAAIVEDRRQPPPDVTVTVPAPVVNVTVPARGRVSKSIERDRDGNIIRVTESEE